METQGSKTGHHNRPQAEMEAKPQTETKHPDQWEQDLSPDHMAGQNIGSLAADREQGLPTAYDVKDVHRSLHDQFDDTELRQIPILAQGQRLQQGATYVDLRDPERREITAMGNMSAGSDNRYVPKDAVPYSLWNRLRGVDSPERIAERRDPDLE